MSEDDYSNQRWHQPQPASSAPPDRLREVARAALDAINYSHDPIGEIAKLIEGTARQAAQLPQPAPPVDFEGVASRMWETLYPIHTRGILVNILTREQLAAALRAELPAAQPTTDRTSRFGVDPAKMSQDELRLLIQEAQGYLDEPALLLKNWDEVARREIAEIRETEQITGADLAIRINATDAPQPPTPDAEGLAERLAGHGISRVRDWAEEVREHGTVLTMTHDLARALAAEGVVPEPWRTSEYMTRLNAEYKTLGTLHSVVQERDELKREYRKLAELAGRLVEALSVGFTMTSPEAAAARKELQRHLRTHLNPEKADG